MFFSRFRLILGGACFALATWATPAGAIAAVAGGSVKPNIILIYADDHSEAAISVYGSRINRTPNIDRLAAEGMRFTQSFVANSICGPARATLLTGLHSHANGRINNQSAFRDDLPTWAKSMQAAGYQTAVVGKWHLPTKPNGFDFWAKTGGYYVKGMQSSKGWLDTPGYTVDLITETGLQWVQDRDPDRPFILWLSHNAAHRTWMPSAKHLTMYRGEVLPEPATLFDDYSGRSIAAERTQMRIARDLFPAYDLKLPVSGSGILDKAAERNLQFVPAKVLAAWHAAYDPENEAFAKADLQGDDLVRWKYQRYIQDYLRCVASVDDSVGRVVDFLKEQKLDQNTIVIYTSDQGFYLGEHGWYDKRWMYEPSLRTPMIVRWPGKVKAGSTCDQMVQNIDLAPTLLEMAGLESEPTMHGESLVGLLSGETPTDWRDSIYYHYQEYGDSRTQHRVARHYGIRTQRYKLIYIYQHDAWELYDLKNDPEEMHNLYQDKNQATRIAALKEKLAELRVQFGDETGPSY
jgi:arylsulfatase A-like enzyme